MATNSSEPEPEEDSNQNDHEGERTLAQGCSRFSRSKIDSSFEEYAKSKEAKRLEGTSKIQSRRAGLNPGKGLNKVSRKQKKKNSDYKKAREEHYSKIENRRCALCGTTDNLSVHHTKKRGNNIADASTFITLCILGSAIDAIFPELNSCQGLGCHGKVERNKGWARDNNLLE